MPRHIPRDHLKGPDGRSYCGRRKNILQWREFLESPKRCRHCESASSGFPPVRPKKPDPIRVISIRPTPAVSAVLDRLASEGQLGESIGALLEWAIAFEDNHNRFDCGDEDFILDKFWRKD